MSLNVEEDFSVVDSVGVGLTKVFECQLFIVRFVLEHRNSLVVKVEKILQIRELFVSIFQGVQGRVDLWQRDLVLLGKAQ